MLEDKGLPCMAETQRTQGKYSLEGLDYILKLLPHCLESIKAKDAQSIQLLQTSNTFFFY